MKTTRKNMNELRPRPVLGRFAMLAPMAFSAFFAHVQPILPPQAIDQFQRVIGSRVEALTILGGDYGAAGGVYAFRGGNVADLDIAKLGGGGAVTSPKPLGVGDMTWASVLQGNLGHMSAENRFPKGYLQGNRSLYDLPGTSFKALRRAGPRRRIIGQANSRWA
jgi:hypothetical protein